jgi:hypothetical protein
MITKFPNTTAISSEEFFIRYFFFFFTPMYACHYPHIRICSRVQEKQPQKIIIQATQGVHWKGHEDNRISTTPR